MIRKSLATALGLLLLYQAWLDWARPLGNQSLTFTHGNIMSAERFLFERHDQPILFIGSSLTLAMKPYLEQEREVGCVALMGQGVLDGMEIVQHSGAHPALIMLEINRLSREPRREFLDELFRPELFWLRKAFSATRHEYQPANLFVPWLENQVRGQNPAPPILGRSRPLPQQRSHQPDLPNQHDAHELKDDLERSLNLLPTIYERAQQLHVEICLYEVAEHPEVTNSVFSQQLRDAVQARFHKPVLLDRSIRYYTVDGEHLAPEDASAYAYFLLKEARQRYSQPQGK